MTVVDPNVSTAFMRRMMALWRAILRIPSARVMTRIIGKPSGTMATKMAIATINWSTATSQRLLSPPIARIIFIETRSTATIKAMNPRKRPKDSNFSSRGVLGVTASEISLAI